MGDIMDARSLKCMFSSMKLDYATPQEVFDQLDSEFHFNLDACANKENTKVPSLYFEGDYALNANWWTLNKCPVRVFCNPPYGNKIGKYLKKGYEEFLKGSAELVVFLIPSRTDTQWWHNYVMKAQEIRFVKGRIRFDGKNPAPFPSCVAIFRN